MGPLRNFIDGELVSSKGTDTLDVLNPATGEACASVPVSLSSDVDAAVAAATAAFPSWSGLTVKSRASIMFKFHSLVDAHSEELAKIIVTENGKNMTEALADVAKGNETAEWACSLPQLLPGRILEVSRGINCHERRTPLGVVGAVVPFNFPVMVPLWTIPIALVTGNCVVCKPSEKVPSGMQKIAELLKEAGLPKGVFNLVHGTVEVVNRLCAHPDIAGMTFVGSSRVAEIVATKCHGLNKRVLALGGAKNHLVAAEDCDVGMANKDIVASFAGCAGQRCMAASALILIDSPNSDNVLKAIVDTASKLAP